MSLILRLFICLQVLSVVTTVSARSNRNRYQVCGAFLNMRINELCRGHYNTLTQGGKKRADPIIPTFGAYFQGTDQLNYDETTDNIDNQMKGLTQYQQFQRIRRGTIVEECCRKPCSDATLREFCS